MTRIILPLVAVSFLAVTAAQAQQGEPQAQSPSAAPNRVYDASNDWGLSNAGVPPGPYIKAGGGGSFDTGHEFGNSPVFGAGIGWRFLPFFRSDLTFDYRNDFHDKPLGNPRVRDWSAMLNGYLDLNVPLIRPLIPYVGAGIGIAQNKVGGSTVLVSGTTPAHLTGNSRNQFAWQAMAGFSYYFTPATALDVGYRYFYGGRTRSGPGSGLPTSGNFDAHEIVGAIRFGF